MHDNWRTLRGCGGVAVSPGDVVVVDGNGVVVVPMAQAAVILEQAERLLATEHLLQEKIKAGATGQCG
jgi:4-hydroxy-4-methyl-2-oxoglutarate aldolase